MRWSRLKQSKIDKYEIDTTYAIESFPEAVNSVFIQDPIFVSTYQIKK